MSARSLAARTPETDHAMRLSGWLHSLLTALLVLMVAWRVLLPAVSDRNFGITGDSDSGGWSSDFAAILTYAKALWDGSAGYDVASHLRVTSQRAGRPVEHALPFGYPPTVLWVLGPFCLLPTQWAFVVWTLLGLAAASWMMRGASIWVTAAFFSPLAFSCYKLGQTGILSAVGLVALLARDRAGVGILTSHTGVWMSAFILWMLSAKPPVAVTAAVALLAGSSWRPVAWAALLVVLSLLALTPHLGVGWVGDYLRIVTHYDRESANPIFAWGLVPETMSNLRALLHVTFGLGDHMASRISSLFWLLALLAIVFSSRGGRIPFEARWGCAVLAYLLFCPHLTSTEDLHLVVIIIVLSSAATAVSPLLRSAAMAAIAVALFLASGLVVATSYRIPAVFALKVLLLLPMVRIFTMRSAPRPVLAETPP